MYAHDGERLRPFFQFQSPAGHGHRPMGRLEITNKSEQANERIKGANSAQFKTDIAELARYWTCQERDSPGARTRHMPELARQETVADFRPRWGGRQQQRAQEGINQH